MPSKKTYDNESISQLKGADRVRLRPAVIFGSDNIEGCQHSFFEILSNSIDEAREGHGDTIHVRRFADYSMEIEDFGRGIPVDYNNNENRYNWELVYCELYAGGKYNNVRGENYEFSLGLNGLGTRGPVRFRHGLMSRSCGMAINTDFILKKAKMWADEKTNRLCRHGQPLVAGHRRIYRYFASRWSTSN